MISMRTSYAHRLRLAGSGAAMLIALNVIAAPSSSAQEPHPNSSSIVDSASSQTIDTHSSGEHDYIVQLQPGKSVGDLVAESDLERQDISKKLRGSAVKGAVLRINAAEAAQLGDTPAVEIIEPDQPVRALASQAYSAGVPWGLDRSDQNLGLDGAYRPPTKGAGTHVFVVDTGIDLDHPELRDKIGPGFDVLDRGDANDCHGHGTHVAGTIASGSYGMAPNATIYPVRALDCDGAGNTSGVLSALHWIKKNAPDRSIVNMSLGGDLSSALNRAVADLVSNNIPVVAAAGNERTDACDVSPAAAPAALTVGASDREDQQSIFSNFGPCLDLYAPGTAITSTTPGGGSATYSGTSMAAPHVAGAAAVYWSYRPTANADEVTAAVMNQSSTGVLTLPGQAAQSPNRLLNVNFDGAPVQRQPLSPPVPTPPATPPVPSSAEIPNPPVAEAPPQLRDQSPAKIRVGNVTRKKAKIRWTTVSSAKSYLVTVKRLTRGRDKSKFQSSGSRMKIRGLKSGAKYRITVMGVSGNERSPASSVKIRTKR